MPITASTHEIAFLCHEVNRAYSQALGDDTHVTWEDAPEWQRTSAVNGVVFVANNPDATPADTHANWLAEKEADGWVYGETKDPVAKTHPRLLPYDQLPVEQRVKDSIFRAIVLALTPRA